MKLKVDKRTHRYYIDAPSVSAIVDRIFPFPKHEIDKDILRKAIKRGQCIHKRAELYIKNKVDLGCACGIQSHDKQWEWLKKELDNLVVNNPEIERVESELSFLHIEPTYTGTIDLTIYFNNGDVLVIDLKTGRKKYEAEYCQLSLYKRHIDSLNKQRANILILNSNSREAYDPTFLIDKKDLDQRLEKELALLD